MAPHTPLWEYRPSIQNTESNMLNERKREEVINSLIKEFGCKSYLEVGVRKRKTFDAIKCIEKIGIDIDCKTEVSANSGWQTIQVASDEYFWNTLTTPDIVFVDGLHHSAQAFRDIINACMQADVVVVHDCLPQSERAQTVPRPEGGGDWNGDVWRAYLVAKIMLYQNWQSYLIRADHGLGVFTLREEEIDPKYDMDQISNLIRHIKTCDWDKGSKILNMIGDHISWETFKNRPLMEK